MTEQLRGRVKVSPEGKHHRGEGVAAGVVGKSLADARSLRPRFQQTVDLVPARQLEHKVLRSLVAPFRHPFQCLGRKRQVNGFLCLLHGYRQTVLTAIYEDILPFQSFDVTDAEAAETGEQVGMFYLLVLHRGRNEGFHLLNGHIGAFALRQVDFVRLVDKVKRIGLDMFRPDGRVQRTVQHTVIVFESEIRHALASRTVFRQQIVDIALAESLVNPVQRHPFPGIIPDDADGYLDLVFVFLAPFLLVFLVGFHPVQQKDLLLFVLDSRLTVGHLDDALRLELVGRIHRRLVLLACILICFRDDIQLQILVCALAVPVYVQIQALASVAQRFHPETNRLFHFFRLSYSCHRESVFVSTVAKLRIIIRNEKQTRNKNVPNKNQKTANNENN